MDERRIISHLARIYLIFKHANWCRTFSSKDELLAYLRENGFTKGRLEDYLLIYGDGLWNEIWMELPTGPQKGQAGEDQSAF